MRRKYWRHPVGIMVEKLSNFGCGPAGAGVEVIAVAVDWGWGCRCMYSCQYSLDINTQHHKTRVWKPTGKEAPT